jgi:hypothetical protein
MHQGSPFAANPFGSGKKRRDRLLEVSFPQKVVNDNAQPSWQIRVY